MSPKQPSVLQQMSVKSLPQLAADETLPAVPPAAKTGQRANGWLRSAILAPARLMPVAYSFADQVLAIGGGFLANVALARTQTKEEYGMFALSYSVYMLLTSLHNATILEPFTVYGSGRYGERFGKYLRLMTTSNVVLGLVLTGILLPIYLVFSWTAPQLMSRALLGLALTVGILLSGIFLRRVFYVQRQAALAATCSLVFFLTVACGLYLTEKTHHLDSFSVFLVLALGWVVAGASFWSKLRFGSSKERFLDLQPHYWREHWNYSKWVLATAFVFQFTTQGYYWLVAGFLSTKGVAELRAMYLLVSPIEQALIAVSYLIVPALAAHYASNRMKSFLSLWKRFTLAAVGVTGLFAIAVRLVGKPAMHVLYAGRYDGLAAYLFVLALLPMVLWIGNTMSHAQNAVEKPRFVFWAFLASAAATFLAGIPLVKHYGLWGAVYGMLLSAVTFTAAAAIGFFFNIYAKVGRQRSSASPAGLASELLEEER